MQGLRYLIWVLGGYTVCAASISTPRLRPSPYFGSVAGLSYSSIENLGRHDYNDFSGENNALVYTAKAGYIDVGHLRESADRMRYLFEICRENIRRSNTHFSFEVIEPAVYHVTLEYPDNWSQLTEEEKRRIAQDVSIDLGQHFAHLSTVWHEIITWYGYASTGLLSEKASSFSWEDSYSDLLGTKLSAMAIRENSKSYNDAMREIIIRETMTPKESERKHILAIIKPSDGTTLEPQKDFLRIIDHIRKLAIRQSGKDVDKPILE